MCPVHKYSFKGTSFCSDFFKAHHVKIHMWQRVKSFRWRIVWAAAAMLNFQDLVTGGLPSK